MEKKLVLIDGHSILNRAFYGVPDLTNTAGTHTNAVYGFLNIMFKFLDEEQPDRLIIAFDVKAPTFRHNMYKEYKGTRKPMLPELVEQVPLIKEVIAAMNITIAELSGYEADDVIGTLAKTAEKEGYLVSVVSGDKDLLQLATSKIKIRIPTTRFGKTTVKDYYEKDVVEAYNVTPTEFIDVKALMGDASDNIPGVPSIGEKTAIKVIEEYGSIEVAYEHVEELKPPRASKALKEHYELAVMSKKLATINTEAPVEVSVDNAKLQDIYTAEAYELVKFLEFKTFYSKFENDTATTNDFEEFFKHTADFGEVEEIFNKAKSAIHIGLAIVIEEDVCSVSIAYSEKDIFCINAEGFVTKEYLLNKVSELMNSDLEISVIGLKNILHLVHVEKRKNIFDCEIAQYLINPLKESYKYDDIARDNLGINIFSEQELRGKRSLAVWMQDEVESYSKYCCLLAYVPYMSKKHLVEELEKLNMFHLFCDIEMPLVYVLYSMENIGVKVEKETLKEYGDKLAVRIEKLQTEIFNEIGEEFNINSPKQLGDILYVKLGIPGGKKTKTGYSTSADILEKLQKEYPIVSKILEYRQYTKLKSTYADGLANYIREDDRIYGKFNQTITATGRISSTEPNLQNIPIRMDLGREIRKVFVPKEDYVFIDADYSQIELRVLAHISNDEHLIEAYRLNEDIHKITAAKVFHVPLEEVTDRQRSEAKAVNFGIVYGISSFGLGQDLNISRKKAEEYIQQYFETYPQIKLFLDETVDQAKKTGYVSTMFSRRRPIPEISSSNYMKRSFGERIAMNSPIQGTAADIIKIAMINVEKELAKRQLKSRLVLQVHDELLVEAHKDEVEDVKAILSEVMPSAATLSVPLDISMEVGYNWFECH